MSKTNRYNVGNNYVPPLPEKRVVRVQETPIEGLLPIQDAVEGLMRQNAYTGRIQQQDDAVTHARATLIVSAAYIVAAAMVTVGLLLVAWLFRALGSQWALYVHVGLLLWGVFVLVILLVNRRQSLWNSAAGIAHHELSAKERIAHHAIDTHADLLLARWENEREE